jgi:Uma2 family endonuclease
MRTAALLTAGEFARVAPVLGPCELVNGEIVPMSPGGIRHSKVTGRAYFLLADYNRRHPLGHVLTGEAGILVARHPDTVRGADVAFISYSRFPADAGDDGFLEHPPELIVEVFGSDASWQAMEAKVAEYHTFGVDLVWVLDPQTLALRAYPRGGSPALFRDDDTVTADPFVPGLSIEVRQFFED